MPVPKAGPAKRSLALPIGAALVAAAGLVGGWFLSQRGGAPAAAAPVTFNRLTFAKGMMRSARFAPDGKTIVYGAAWNGPPIKLYLTRTDSKESAPIPAPPAELFSISKSGEMAVGVDYRFYGWMGEGTLARTSLLGGTPREVANNVRDADWSPDGSQLAVVRRVEGFDQLEYPVGKVLDKTVGYFGSIRISPDGERIAYSDHPVWGDNVGDIAVVDRNGEKTRLAGGFAGVEGVAWAPGGREVWFTGTSEGEMNLYAVDLSGARRVIYSSIDAIELFDIAPDGRALLGRQRNDRSTIALLAGDAEPRTIVVPGEASVARAMTPDGRALAVASHLTQTYDTFLIRADRPGAVRLSEGDSHALSWDGAWSLTAPADNDSTHVTPTGQGPTRAIPNPDGVSYLTIAAFLPDGKRFLSTGRKGSGPQLGWVFDVETGKATPFTTEEVRWPSFVVPPVAPDGSEVILRAADGTPKRWPLAGGSPRPIPGILPDDQPLTFTEDGRAIFVAGRTLPVSIERLDLSSGRRTPWLTLVPENPAGMRYSIPTLTPDGKHWALCTAKLFTDLFVVTGLR
jgi:dipeptidyl aminopeptidase/acylaminoacyl peptidase